MAKTNPPGTKADTLEREYLTVRAKLLEVGAALDRLDRGGGDLSVADAARRERLERAVRLLADQDGREQPDRAERLQLLFSREYDSRWREQFEV